MLGRVSRCSLTTSYRQTLPTGICKQFIEICVCSLGENVLQKLTRTGAYRSWFGNPDLMKTHVWHAYLNMILS